MVSSAGGEDTGTAPCVHHTAAARHGDIAAQVEHQLQAAQEEEKRRKQAERERERGDYHIGTCCSTSLF